MMEEVYTPNDIERLIGRRLVRENGPLMEFVSDEDITPVVYEDLAGEVHEEDDEEFEQRLYELAEVCREEAAENHPENAFRYVSRLQKDNARSYWYEIDVTDAGERARACWQRRQCCDQHGNLDTQATIAHWQQQLEVYPPPRFFFNPPHFVVDGCLDSWINEPWAADFRKCMELRTRGLETRDDGTPLYDKTMKQWQRWLDMQTEKSLVERRTELFRLDPEWAQFIHDAVMVAMMKSNHVALI